MARLLHAPLSTAICLGLAACGGPDPAANQAVPVEPSAAHAPPSEPLAVANAEVPEAFRGTWDASAAACAGPPGEMRLSVAADRLSFHEGVARVGVVRQQDEAMVRAELLFESEGEEWRETRSLRLMVDGRLTIERDGVSTTRVRCADD